MLENGIEIRRLLPDASSEYFDLIAELHISEIHHGLLPVLGKRFISNLYRGLAKARMTGVWIALKDDDLVGFIAGCANTRRSMLSVLISHAPNLIFSAWRAVFFPAFFSKVLAALAYPFRGPSNSQKQDIIPEAELLSICVAPTARGCGVGRALVRILEGELREWSLSGFYHVKTNREEVDSNAFYKVLGFEKKGTIQHHDLVLQIYVKPIALSDATAMSTDNSL